MRRRPPINLRIAILALQAAWAPMAAACGFDGLLGDQFSAQHAKSLPVAFAISDAVGAGVIGKEALAPIEKGQKGYWRAMSRLQRFAQLLEEAADRNGLPPVSILLIDSQLWTRLRPGQTGYEIEAHALRPATGDVTIVTNEFVLAKIIEGSLSARRALDLGVLAVDGETRLVKSVQDKMLAQIGPDRSPSSAQMARKLLSPWGGKSPPGSP